MYTVAAIDMMMQQYIKERMDADLTFEIITIIIITFLHMAWYLIRNI